MENRTEKRLTRRLINYWESLRTGDNMPEMAAFDIGAIAEIWAKCVKIKVGEGGYQFEYMGRDISAAYGRDLTGQSTDTANKGFPGFFICRNLDKTLGERNFIEDTGYFLAGVSTKVVKYRACSLPFTNAEKEPTHIIVGLSYKLSGM